MLLTSRTEQLDVLKVLAATRREVRFLLDTSEPLRKPRSRQSERTRPGSERARTKLSATLESAQRKPFRGRVAVRLDLTLPPAYASLGLRRVVKEHIDLLQGIVFADDAVIDHVEAHRTVTQRGRALAEIRCLPLSAFSDDFDRAFRVWDEIGVPAPARGWGKHFGVYDLEVLRYDEEVLGVVLDLDAQEKEQLAEDPDAMVDLDIPGGMAEFSDWQVRESTREHLIESTARARGVWLCDQGLDGRDRPGPPPSWLAEARVLDTADIVSLPNVGPGCFILPPPPKRSRQPGEPKWETRVLEQIRRQLRRERMARVRFEGPVALDIAFRTGSADHADLDNLAHRIIATVQKAFPQDDFDVAGYRAYRQSGDAPNVRVRLLPHSRLLALGAAMDRARAFIRAERGARARALA